MQTSADKIETKHTPGPWKWLGEGILANDAADEIPLAFLFDEPDALLIAAAPDLLAALKRLNDEATLSIAHCDLIRAALAKAGQLPDTRGEAHPHS